MFTGCNGATEAVPNTAACCSRSAQIFSNAVASTQRPLHCSHSRNLAEPIATAAMFIWQRGHFADADSMSSARAAAAPQCGQCLLPRNIIPKHEGHATVASREPQKTQVEASDELAAPQFGQLSVWASMVSSVEFRGYAAPPQLEFAG